MNFGKADETSIAERVSRLVDLARNDEAARLLAVEGVLEPQLDITFLDDPLDWIAYDIAQAIRVGDAEGEEESGPTLGTLVAELRLYRVLRREVDEAALARLVQEYVDSEED